MFVKATLRNLEFLNVAFTDLARQDFLARLGATRGGSLGIFG